MTNPVKLTVRLSATEAALIKQTALASNLTQNDFLCQCLLESTYRKQEGWKSSQEKLEFMIKHIAFVSEVFSRLAKVNGLQEDLTGIKQALQTSLEEKGYIRTPPSQEQDHV